MWINDWAWGVPLITLTVMIQSLALFAIGRRLMARVTHYKDTEFSVAFALKMGAVVLFATLLLAVEAGIWAGVYVAIGAVPDFGRGMLYSLEAMTTFGHAAVYLPVRWQFLGALEALNGVILIGLTTAFMFSIIHRAEIRWNKMQ